MNIRQLSSVHLTGIGGINMSALAKLLLAAGIRVSGSDIKENDQTKVLSDRGATIHIGEDESFIPPDAELLIYTSAAPETNRERREAKRRGIPERTNFEFIAQWFLTKKVVLVTGTHGKSTTTAMLGRALIAAEMHPTVIVGSKVPDFEEGNIFRGSSDIVVIEGDEYAKHFLEFRPYAVLINNIELDHTDIFTDLKSMIAAFCDLLNNVQHDGIIIANIADRNVKQLLMDMSTKLAARNIQVIPFNAESQWRIEQRKVIQSTDLISAKFNEAQVFQGVQVFQLFSPLQKTYPIHLQIPGLFNAINAMGALVMAQALGADITKAISSLDTFTGIWRRFESLGLHDGVHIFTDYGHHPTAVSQTLVAAHESFPDSKIILCFQPHHRNRTKHLFFEFESSFDEADSLVLCEIYDVAGRDGAEDEHISSKDFLDVIARRDAEHGKSRTVEYAENPKQAVQIARTLSKPGDILIVMGAGDIDAAIRQSLV
ncbi:UDP-N-acetylmuramate--L-alanine ligase [Candidatus Uhrbacteria bacterium]|nr:UDP-N-acetylmuramate--L-alanine ligase [Candidatus Uhrbacteria bacterium]